MTPAKTADPMVNDVLEAIEALSGPHAGYRPVHAKGILLAGTFTPKPAGGSLTRAPHLARKSTPVTVRFSDGTGLPDIADNDPNAGPRGMAIRFHLAEHVHTDIIAHSVDGFPARTVDEFLELLRAIGASQPGTARPTPIEKFLATHPAALEYVQMPKPLPASFFQETFFAPNAYRFINGRGESQFGRYRIRPEGGAAPLNSAEASGQSPNFLFDEVRERLGKGAVRMRVAVQLAGANDITDDATMHWPKDRPEIDLGALEIQSVLADSDAEQQHIIFDPIPRVDGIEPSADPLLEPRAAVYLASGRRRRSAVRN
jgi:catalase